MFERAVCAALLCLVSGVVIPLAAQIGAPVVPPPKTPPQPRSEIRDSQMSVVITGCIWGNRLTVDGESGVDAKALGASEYILEGPKELLQQLKTDHEGHEDEIAGIAIVPAGNVDGVDTRSKPLGPKTRVTAGAGRPSESGPPRAKTLRLRVASIRHISNKCSVAR